MLESRAQLDHIKIWLQLPNIREPEVRQLFETFWTTAHICFPILDQAALRRLYDSLPPADHLRVDRSNCALAAILFSLLALSALYQRTKAEAEYYYWWASCMAKLDVGKYELEMVMVNILKASKLAHCQTRKLTCRPAIALISRVQVNGHITGSLILRYVGVDIFRFVVCRPEWTRYRLYWRLEEQSPGLWKHACIRVCRPPLFRRRRRRTHDELVTLSVLSASPGSTYEKLSYGDSSRLRENETISKSICSTLWA